MRDRVSRVVSQLPDDADAPRISKRSVSGMADLVLGLSHPTMTQMELTDYADRYLLDRFSVVDGVAQAQIFGEKRYSMRDLARSEGARGAAADRGRRRERAPKRERRAAGGAPRIRSSGSSPYA